MAIDLSGLSSVTTSATALSNLILVSPQNTIGYQPQTGVAPVPGTQPQPPALLFHYEGENRVSLKSDITDHYIENNSPLEDQIALKPEMIRVHGFIGELNDIPPAALALVQQAALKLSAISAYAPSISVTALIAYNTAFQLYQTGANAVNAAVSSWSSINGSGGENVISSTGIQSGAFNASSGSISNNQNKQQVAFQQFYGYWSQRTLFTVQTPWAVFQNMAIESLEAMQDESTRMITDFEVTFKMMRFAQVATPTTTVSGGPNDYSGRAAAQISPAANLGSTSGTAGTTVGTSLATLGVA